MHAGALLTLLHYVFVLSLTDQHNQAASQIYKPPFYLEEKVPFCGPRTLGSVSEECL